MIIKNDNHNVSGTDTLSKRLELTERVPESISGFWAALKSFFHRVGNVLGAIASAIESLIATISSWIGIAVKTVILLVKIAFFVLLAIAFFWLLKKIYRMCQPCFENWARASAAERALSEERARDREAARSLRQLRAAREIEEREQTQRAAERARKLAEDQRREQERRSHQMQQEARRRACVEKWEYAQWKSRCERFLDGREHLSVFPPLPSWCCSIEGCTLNERLRICKHSLGGLYRASGEDYMTLLKRERITRHPDKFARCREDVREGIQLEAAELFKMIDELLKEGQGSA